MAEERGKKASRELPERWSAQQKAEVVLRLLRGADRIRTRAKLGETMMKLELAEGLLEKRGYGDELRRLKRSQG